jgi:hypothetical protein
MSHRNLYLGIVCLAVTGCSQHQLHGPQTELAPRGGPAIENPIFVPVTDHEFVWNQVVDTIDDYFKIAHEERVRFIGGVVTEGRIDTVPLTGATMLEPWRHDSTRGYEKLHATLQSIQRRAMVRVIPESGGYLIDVAVFKELEDVDRAEHSTVGAATPRHDSSLVRNAQVPARKPTTLGWIALGRDITLEHQILAELQGRLAAQPHFETLPPVDSLFSR